MSILQVFGRHAGRADDVLRLLRLQVTRDEELDVLRRLRDHFQAGRPWTALPADLAARAGDILQRALQSGRSVPVDNVIGASGRGFTVSALQHEYRTALARRGQMVDDLPPRDWLRSLPRGTGPYRLAQLHLGAGFLRELQGITRYRNMGSIARPSRLDQPVLGDILRRLEADMHALGDRLDNMIDEIRDMPPHLRRREGLSLNEGHLSILSGNVGEILARPQMLDLLREARRSHPDAVLLAGARYRPRADQGPALLFIDGLIADFSSGVLRIVDRIEVKNMRNADTGVRQHVLAAETRVGGHGFIGTADEAAEAVEASRAARAGGRGLAPGPDLPDAIVLHPQGVRVWDGGSAEGIPLAGHGDDLAGQYMIGTTGPGRRAVSTQTSSRHVIIPGGVDPMGSTSVGVHTGFDLVPGELTVHTAMGVTYNELYYVLAEAVDLLKRHHGL